MTRTPASTATTATEPLEDRPGAGNSARTAAQRISGCRWIEGDVRTPEWRYCQDRRLPGRSYCGEHHARSINPDGDPQFTAEQAECDHYLCDLPPPEDELDGELDSGLDGA